ncbi:hypothetical protein CcaverHIS002_0602350 [Cutaneotrichosporon cavernicola]|uniref:Uncharacterized protein n=1 Tax=Cutaneotrichosporon cavernicola TaxID=279322 RepID=A0AA48L889_9TREE|nr:uncharacterized protein CcaverHIS019_0601840 [Cutaneotrichosporon cavernicola]BEI85948.1 hypothetical protein CcaverHIS002_0602350 [Cutaneotrichosporon cavernicola]BEI93725.1 hypothetical protein CcaverHIS019_0601840 [Cutaneotrichosporon cavernicola]
MRASTAHSALLLVATLVALAAVGCNGYMLYHVQRAFASSPSPTSFFHWRVLLISAEAVSGATALFAITHAIIRRINAYSSLVSVRIDVSLLVVFGGGAAAIGVLLFLSHVPGQHVRLYSIEHCHGLGKHCAIHFAGGAALLLSAFLLLVNATFEALYASSHPGGWTESIHALASDLGSDAPKLKKTKSTLSISAPFTDQKDSIDTPLMPPAPCATLPPLTYNGHGMELDPLNFGNLTPMDLRPTPAPPSPARPESSLGPRFPKSTSSGSVGTVSTLATTPLFGLAPAYMSPGASPGARTSSLSQGGTFGKDTNPYRTPSTRSTNPYPRDENIHLSPPSPIMDNPYRSASRDDPYRSPSRKENPYRSPSRKENPYRISKKTSTNTLQPPIERDRAKLSMEQIDRKRTLFADGML